MVRKKLRPPEVNEGSKIRAPAASSGSTQREFVTLSFEYFMVDCIRECQIDHVALWTDKLRRLTASTWQMVTSAPREGLGCEKIPEEKLADEVSAGLPKGTEFLSFRCSDAIRMIGFRRGAVLHVRLVAPDKKAY